MNGTAVETVASSWIEALGGVSICWIFRMPPAFCASAGSAIPTANAITPTNTKHANAKQCIRFLMVSSQ